MPKKLLKNWIFLGLVLVVLIGITVLTINISDSSDLLPGMAGVNEQAVSCQISANLTPTSGLRLPQILSLSASDTNGCNVPVQYTWNCTSLNTALCPEFLSRANISPNGISNPTLNLIETGIFQITVTICETGNPNNCSTVTRSYQGDEIQ
jgi:hypothetical protein